MSDSYAHACQTMHTFEQALEAALAASICNVKRLGQSELRNFNLSVTPSDDELKDLYEKRHDRYVHIASLCIPYKDRDGFPHKAAVTPVYVAVKDQTFHTITLRRIDGATVVVLVRDCDNYVVGFHIYLNEIEAKNAPWLVFKGVELPRSLGNVLEIQYHFAYETIVDIKFGENTLADTVEFLIGFRTNPNQSITVSGKLLMGSLFVLFGEAQRFRAARNWILSALCSTPQNIPEDIADIFRNWSVLSQICSMLYLAMLEKSCLGSDFYFRPAISSWIKAEKFHKDRDTVLKFKFRNMQKKIHLNCLLGAEVFLLRHNFDFCTRILMLQLGYGGDLKMNLYNIKNKHGKKF